jgi:hypothetical protein
MPKIGVNLLLWVATNVSYHVRVICCKVLMHLVIYAHSHIVKVFAQTKSHNQTLPLFMLL